MSILSDARHRVRWLWRNKGFTALVVTILGIGIGTSTASLALVDALAVRPLAFTDPDALVSVDEIEIPWASAGVTLPPSRPTYRDVGALRETFSGVGAYAIGELNLGGIDNPRRVRVGLVTPSLFPLLGSVPVRGRLFNAQEGETASSSLILSRSFWRGPLAADDAIIGSVLSLNGHPHNVVGIVDGSRALPADVDVWIPLAVPFVFGGAPSEAITTRLQERIVARLVPGITVGQAERRVRELFERYGETAQPVGSPQRVVPLRGELTASRRPVVAFLLGMSLLLLVAACANAIHLLCARARTRRTELSVRTALGATPSQLVVAQLAESLCYLRTAVLRLATISSCTFKPKRSACVTQQ